MKNVLEYIVGCTLLISALAGVGITLCKRRTRFAILSLNDAAFSAIIGCCFLATAQGWLPKHMNLVLFCATLCNSQFSCLAMAALVQCKRRALVVSLILLTWCVPVLCAATLAATLATTRYSTSPIHHSCSQHTNNNQSTSDSLTSLLVQRIYALVHQDVIRNRSQRNYEQMTPTWFEEKYEDDVYDIAWDGRNESDSEFYPLKPLNNVTGIPDKTDYFQNILTTLSLSDCESLPPASLVCFVLIIFLGFMLPLLFAAVMNARAQEQARNTQQLALSWQRPVPRPRSAPPCDAVIRVRPLPAPRAVTAAAPCSPTPTLAPIPNQGSSSRLSCALTACCAAVFCPALVSALLDLTTVTGGCRGLSTISHGSQFAAIALNAIIRALMHSRLITNQRIQPQ